MLFRSRTNEGLLEKPQMEPVPELPAGVDAAAAEKKDAAEELKKADEEEAKTQAAVEERRRVERENRRKQEEYDRKLEAARKRVRELNARFADWFYVVSDAECGKIRLDRAAVVQKKPAEETK